MGSGCSAHSSIHAKNPVANKGRVKEMRGKVVSDELIRKRKKLIFCNEEGENKFFELTSPRNGSLVKWRKGDLIGEGAFAKVYQCINLKSGELMAVKRFMLGDDPKKVGKDFENMKGEVGVLRRLDHENIVKYYQTDLSPDYYTIDILLEFVSGGSLKHLLQKYHPLELDIIRNYSFQILSGLDYLHSNNIVHRDLKSANILVSLNGTLKLTDFGSSLPFEMGSSKLSNSFKGSPYWMAPEVVLRQGHSFPADVWSFACVLIEMVTGQPPWSNYSQETKQVLSLISKEDSYPDIPSTDPPLKHLLIECLNREPGLRPSLSSLKSFSFFNPLTQNSP